MKNEDFIKILISMSKEDIDRFIKEKGKPRKCINPFIHISNGK